MIGESSCGGSRRFRTRTSPKSAGAACSSASSWNEGPAVLREALASRDIAKETHDKVIRFAPPLTITEDEMEWALARIEKVLSA